MKRILAIGSIVALSIFGFAGSATRRARRRCLLRPGAQDHQH